MLIIHFEFTYFLCDEVLYALFKKKKHTIIWYPPINQK